MLFIDFVKEFYRVPRETLWNFFLKFGIPPKFIRLIIALHRIIVQLSINGAEAEIESIIGVKKGDVLGPIIFIIYMVALTNTWKHKEDTSPCLFRSKQSSIITGRCHNIVRGVEEFAMTESPYADNAAFLFPSREIAERNTPRIIKHCAEWGMEVHSGITKTPNAKGKTSKTELLFVEKPSHTELTNLSPIFLEEGSFIPVVNKLCYLGSIINHNIRESEDVDNHIKKASQAFGALRRGVFTSKSTSFNIKKAVYTALILSVLLHGAEEWSLTET